MRTETRDKIVQSACTYHLGFSSFILKRFQRLIAFCDNIFIRDHYSSACSTASSASLFPAPYKLIRPKPVDISFPFCWLTITTSYKAWIHEQTKVGPHLSFLHLLVPSFPCPSTRLSIRGASRQTTPFKHLPRRNSTTVSQVMTAGLCSVSADKPWKCCSIAF